MVPRLVVAAITGGIALAYFYSWRSFPLHLAAVTGAMIAFLSYHILQTIARLRAIYRKEEW